MTLRVEILKDKFSQSLGLPFKELLPESAIKQAISELKIKYTLTGDEIDITDYDNL